MSVATERQPAAATKRRAFDVGGFFTYKRQLVLLLLPYLLGMAGLIFLPMLLSVPFAFTDYRPPGAPAWNGFENFTEMFSDSRFLNSVQVSAFFIALAVPLRLVGAVFLAFLLHKARPGNRIYRVLVYLPTIMPDVAYALLWLYIFNPLFGPLNWILPLFGGPAHGWLLEYTPAKFATVIMMVWTIGEGFVLMLAALQFIPKELNEAAEVDGASGMQRFFRITLPLLAPAILLLLFRDTVMSFQTSFVPALVTFGDPTTSSFGKPYYSTEFLPVYIWTNVREYNQFGYASAMTLVMYVVTAIVIGLQFLVARRWRSMYSE